MKKAQLKPPKVVLQFESRTATLIEVYRKHLIFILQSPADLLLHLRFKHDAL
jgi:hypothetical protein